PHHARHLFPTRRSSDLQLRRADHCELRRGAHRSLARRRSGPAELTTSASRSTSYLQRSRDACRTLFYRARVPVTVLRPLCGNMFLDATRRLLVTAEIDPLPLLPWDSCECLL